MPYFIEQVVDGWNTVKDDGTVLAKHKTKKQAVDQMVAVSLAEGIPAGGEFKRAVAEGTYSPPEGVAVAAKRALVWISEGYAGDGFTAVGRARAVQLASGRDISADTVNRMKSYFARHEVDQQATGFNSGEDGYPSAGRVAWDAWGGTSGQTWVNGLNDVSPTRAVDKIDVVMSNEESETRMSDEMPMTKDELVNQVGELKGEVLELVGKLAKTIEDLSYTVECMTDPMYAVEDTMAEPMMEDMSSGMPVVEEDAVRFVEPTQVAELAKRGERVSKGIERRQALQDLEIRQEGDGMTLRGYAAVFNSPSQPLPFIETIQRGAFTESLKSRNDVKLLWNHDTGIVLGSTRAGTLKLTEDERGLLVEASLPDTNAGRDAAYLIKRGDVSAFSFGFRVAAGGDSWPSPNERLLTRVNIHEASLVAFPAYQDTEGTASVRGMSDLTNKIVELAELRGISADELTDALLALEAGSELTERQGELLTDTLSKVLKKDPEVTNPAALLDLKKKQLDLLMQRV